MSDKRLLMPTWMAQVIFKFVWADQPCENVMYFGHQHRPTALEDYAQSPASDGDLTKLLENCFKWWDGDDPMNPFATGGYGVFQSTNVELVGISATRNTVSGAGPLVEINDTSAAYPIPGTNDGDPLPNNASVAVKFSTAFGGRSFHGRFYMVGVNDGLIDTVNPNLIKTASRTDIVKNAKSLSVGIKAATYGGELDLDSDRWLQVVASFRTGGADRDEAIGTEVLTAQLTDFFLDSQVRRLPAHNRHR